MEKLELAGEFYRVREGVKSRSSIASRCPPDATLRRRRRSPQPQPLLAYPYTPEYLFGANNSDELFFSHSFPQVSPMRQNSSCTVNRCFACILSFDVFLCWRVVVRRHRLVRCGVLRMHVFTQNYSILADFSVGGPCYSIYVKTSYQTSRDVPRAGKTSRVLSNHVPCTHVFYFIYFYTLPLSFWSSNARAASGRPTLTRRRAARQTRVLSGSVVFFSFECIYYDGGTHLCRPSRRGL